MIVKPAIKFLLAASDAYVIVTVQAVMAAILLNNAIFISPMPTLAVLQTALDAFIAALQAAALGGPAQTAIKNARRAELCALMRLLANYIGAIADGDMSILLLSGFPHQKPTSAPTAAPTPGHASPPTGAARIPAPAPARSPAPLPQPSSTRPPAPSAARSASRSPKPRPIHPSKADRH